MWELSGIKGAKGIMALGDNSCACSLLSDPLLLVECSKNLKCIISQITDVTVVNVDGNGLLKCVIFPFHI